MTNAVRADAAGGVARDTDDAARHPLLPRPYFNGVYLPSGGTGARIPVMIIAAVTSDRADVAIELLHGVDASTDTRPSTPAEEIVVRISGVDALREGTPEQQHSAAVAVASWIQRVLDPLPRTGRSTVRHIGGTTDQQDAQPDGGDALAPLSEIR